MDPSTILLLFLCMFLLQRSVQAALLLLNVRHLLSNKDTIPAAFQHSMNAETAEKAASYSLARLRFAAAGQLYDTLVLLAIFLSGAIGLLDRWAAGISPAPYLHGIVFLVAAMVIGRIINIPLGLYGTFVLEARYGFNRTTPLLWALDQVRSIIISAVLTSVFALCLFSIMDLTGSSWWIWASAFIIGAGMLLTIIYPRLISPLFNKFTPLPAGALKDGIDKLCKDCNYPLRDVYQMDASKRSSHGNAYFTGFGRAKRIVLFDTLISQLSTEQVLAVLAHEIGHGKHGHVFKGLLLSAASTVGGMWLLSLLLDYSPLYQAFGVTAPSYHAALVICGLVAAPFTYFATPLMSMYSRRCEYEADRYAVKAMGRGEPLSSGLMKMSNNSLVNLWPHPLYSAFYYSHPSLPERVAAIEKADAALHAASK